MLKFAVIEFIDGEQIVEPFENTNDLLSTYEPFMNEIKYIDVVSEDGIIRLYEQ